MKSIDVEAFDKFLENAEVEARRMQRYVFASALNTIRGNLREFPSVDPEPHWIPCSERLPYAEYGESDNVLATCGHRNVEGGIIRWVRTLYFNGGNWCYPTGETYLEKVYAWMPLPEPYQEEGKRNG